MFIVDQERKQIINIDNVLNIGIDDDTIFVYTHVKCMILGIYPPNRAQEVFNEMLKVAFPPNTYILENVNMNDTKLCFDNLPLNIVTQGDAKITRYDIGVYYMPEK